MKEPTASKTSDHAPANEATSSAPRSPEAELDKALDAVAAIIRALGRHAFDLPDASAASIAHLCDKWATHLLVLGPHPSSDPDDDTERKPPVHGREWTLAVQFAIGLQRREHAFIVKALQDLRETIWAFVHGLNQALNAGGDADARMKSQLTRLKSAAHSRSTADLKREAISVAETIGEIFEERTRKQSMHVTKLGERMAELGRALEEARREVAFDALTQLFNRKTFDVELQRTSDLGGLFRQPACLLLIDVDHFKSVNDTYGHPMGDEVLRKLAETLIRTYRRRDDIVARYGGEEFGVILRDTVEREAIMLTERLLENARALRVEQGGRTAQVTVSAGVAEIAPGEAPDDWIARADRALYSAKNTGRDRLVALPFEKR